MSSSAWRPLLWALLVLNLLFWLWTEGHLRLLGLGPKPLQEPERVQQQIRPEALQLKGPSEAASAAAPTAAPH
jgi:hypothetical protein